MLEQKFLELIKENNAEKIAGHLLNESKRKQAIKDLRNSDMQAIKEKCEYKNEDLNNELNKKLTEELSYIPENLIDINLVKLFGWQLMLLEKEEKKDFLKAMKKLEPEIYKQIIDPTFQGSIRTDVYKSKLTRPTNFSFVTINNEGEDTSYSRKRIPEDVFNNESKGNNNESKANNKRVFGASGSWAIDKAEANENKNVVNAISKGLGWIKKEYTNSLKEHEQNAYPSVNQPKNILYSLLSPGYKKEQKLHAAIRENKELFSNKNIDFLYAPAALTKFIVKLAALTKFIVKVDKDSLEDSNEASKKLDDKAKELIVFVKSFAQNLKSENDYYKKAHEILSKKSYFIFPKKRTKQDLKKLNKLFKNNQNHVSDTFHEQVISAVEAKRLTSKRQKINEHLITRIFAYFIPLIPGKFGFGFNSKSWYVIVKKSFRVLIGTALLVTGIYYMQPHQITAYILATLGVLHIIKAIFTKGMVKNRDLSMISLIKFMNPASTGGCKTARDRAAFDFHLQSKIGQSLKAGKLLSHNVNEDYKKNLISGVKAMHDLGQHGASKYEGPSGYLGSKSKYKLLRFALVSVPLGVPTAFGSYWLVQHFQKLQVFSPKAILQAFSPEAIFISTAVLLLFIACMSCGYSFFDSSSKIIKVADELNAAAAPKGDKKKAKGDKKKAKGDKKKAKGDKKKAKGDKKPEYIYGKGIRYNINEKIIEFKAINDEYYQYFDVKYYQELEANNIKDEQIKQHLGEIKMLLACENNSQPAELKTKLETYYPKEQENINSSGNDDYTPSSAFSYPKTNTKAFDIRTTKELYSQNNSTPEKDLSPR